MSKENKTFELNDEKLEQVTGGKEQVSSDGKQSGEVETISQTFVAGVEDESK